jgi:glycine/D-amino acid oxidase-like deaminating enzyme
MQAIETVLTPDRLVAGDGHAAMAAALAAAACGASTVLVGVECDCAATDAQGVRILPARVWGAFVRPGIGPEIIAAGGGVRFIIHPSRVILAPQQHDAAVYLPGATLPGCISAGDMLDWLGRGGNPDGPVVLAGDGKRLWAVASALVRRGVRLAGIAIASDAEVPGFLQGSVVPVWTPTRPVAVEGKGRVAALIITGPEGERRIAASTCVLHWGMEEELGLARALGAAHRVVNGRLETCVDAQGQTSLPWLAVAPQGEPETLAKPPSIAELPGDAIVCPCEGVTAGQMRRSGAKSLAWVKRATRASMGKCGGRSCASAIAALTSAADEADFAAPRMPLRPVLVSTIMADHSDPADVAVTLPPPTRWLTTPPAELPRATEILVIGGGIVGLACALFLAREGCDVVIADRNEPGLAASTANAGSLHVQLVPYVYAAGDGGPMADALPLGPASVKLWQEFARDADESLGLRIEGGLILAETEAELVLLRSKAAFERSRQIPSEVIGRAELATLAPGLDHRFAGAAFCSLEGQGDPLRGTAALLNLAMRAGVRIAPGLEVTGLTQKRATWEVATNAGVLRAGQVVNAAGAQAGRIGALAGVPVPIHALIQQVIATEPAPPLLRQLVAWTGRHLSLKQGEGGHFLIGGGWPGTIDEAGATHVTRSSLEGNLALAARALPALAGVRVTRAWTGLAPNLTRAPVISATPGQPGLWHAVSGNGYTLGPVMGRMLADAVLGRSTLPAAFALYPSGGGRLAAR